MSPEERFQRDYVISRIDGDLFWIRDVRQPFTNPAWYFNTGLDPSTYVTVPYAPADQRLRAFIKKYGIDYTVLIPGEPKELNDKVPQGENLNAFPTSFYIGRDGRVKSVHAGFPGKSTGKFHEEAKAEITALVERLLAEPVRTSASK